MGRQRVQLTDQALVAVRVAREVAAGREASAADLLVGLAIEPDGAAGLRLRGEPAAAVRLSSRAPAAAPALPPLWAVIAAAVTAARPRPPATGDLLAAALAVGGNDLADLLDVCGYDPRALSTDARAAEAVAADETVTLGSVAPFAPQAARIVGRVRALAGGAVDVVLAIGEAADPEVTALVAPADGDGLAAGRAMLEAGEVGRDWDRGLGPVLAGAVVLAGDGPVALRHLLHAAVVGGGDGPLAVLEAARRFADEQGAR